MLIKVNYGILVAMGARIKKVSIIGLGYIGLPTFVALSKTKKYDVVGYDVDPQKIKLLSQKISPIEDKDVQEYVKNHLLKISTQKNILVNSQVFIICVPTPIYDDYTPNYQFIENAVKTIAPYITRNCQVVLESTVNPGTCRELIAPLLKKHCRLKVGKDYNLAHCPERINPGDSQWNIYNIARNIGSLNKKYNKQIADFYRTFITNAEITQVSSLEVAEATKVVENTFRDINIAYVNELAKSFDAIGIDLHETLKAASSKPFSFLAHWPGCGVGGHCIAVDPYYLIDRAAKSGFTHSFLKVAREINNSMPQYTVDKLVQGLNDLRLPVKGTRIVILGLAYKPGLSDTRESPGIKIRELLIKLGAKIKVFDPFVKSDYRSLKKALKTPAAVIIACAHQQFIDELPKLLPNANVKIIVDGRNCLDKKFIESNKIIYKGIGR